MVLVAPYSQRIRAGEYTPETVGSNTLEMKQRREITCEPHHIHNPLVTPNPAAASLELIPNNQMPKEKPVEFSIEFTEAGMCTWRWVNDKSQNN